MDFSSNEIIDSIPDFVKLADVSERDKVWDTHKNETISVEEIYDKNSEFHKYSLRMRKCSGWLAFNELTDQETGEVSYKLSRAQFCRVRTCPICQWRRSLMWKARFYAALPKIKEDYPDSAFLLLTLTIRNCEIENLRTTLDTMHKSFRKMMKYKNIKKAFKGWIRTTEVTRAEDGSAHPHYHVLVMVNKSYFTSRDFISHSDFVETWKRACKLSYAPNVDVRRVKSKEKNGKKVDEMTSVIAETLKYTVKPSDLITDENWLYEFTRQVHKLRFIDTGGTLKDVFRVDEDEEKDEDFIHFVEKKDEQEYDDESIFHWNLNQKCYTKKRNC